MERAAAIVSLRHSQRHSSSADRKLHTGRAHQDQDLATKPLTKHAISDPHGGEDPDCLLSVTTPKITTDGDTKLRH
jgi:hypothetical protein